MQAPAPCRYLSFRGSRPPRRACRCRSNFETRGAEDQQKPEFNLQSPTETVQWGGTLPSGRRAVLSGFAGLSIGKCQACLLTFLSRGRSFCKTRNGVCLVLLQSLPAILEA